MKGSVTAIIEACPEGGYWAFCPEIPGANGQGETLDETRKDLRAAVQLILKDRMDDFSRGLSKEAIREELNSRIPSIHF